MTEATTAVSLPLKQWEEIVDQLWGESWCTDAWDIAKQLPTAEMFEWMAPDHD